MVYGPQDSLSNWGHHTLDRLARVTHVIHLLIVGFALIVAVGVGLTIPLGVVVGVGSWVTSASGNEDAESNWITVIGTHPRVSDGSQWSFAIK